MYNKISPAKLGNFQRTGKRKRLINAKECQYDMKESLFLIFNAYHKAVELYNSEIRLTNPQDRVRGMEASYFNAKLMQCLREVFPNNLKRGKYGRMFLYSNEYIVLFKKLDKNGKPMNIRTKLSSSIENQMQGNLFDNEEDGTSPIIFFGYSKSLIGEMIRPRIVYIDEECVKWTIEEKDILPQKEVTLFPVQTPEGAHVSVKPHLKVKKKVN